MPRFQPELRSWPEETAERHLAEVANSNTVRARHAVAWAVGYADGGARSLPDPSPETVAIVVRALCDDATPMELGQDGMPPWFGWELPRTLGFVELTREVVWTIDALARCIAECMISTYGARWRMDTDPSSTVYRQPVLSAVGGRMDPFSLAFDVVGHLINGDCDRAVGEWDEFILYFEGRRRDMRGHVGEAKHEDPETPLVELEWVDSPEVGSGWELWVSEDADPPVPLDALYSPLESFLADLPQVSTVECTDRYQYQLKLADASEGGRSSIVTATERYLRDAMNK